jgi:hypothetical protein
VKKRRVVVIAVLGANKFDLSDRRLQNMYLNSIVRIALNRIPIRTGASTGCDQIAAQTALETSGRVQLVLPWADWEEQWVTSMREKYPARCTVEVFDPVKHAQWLESVEKYRRPGENLTVKKYALYARVYGIVEPCEIVLCMTLRSETGGTGQGMRIARGLGKQVLDVRRPADQEMLDLWLRGLPQH